MGPKSSIPGRILESVRGPIDFTRDSLPDRLCLVSARVRSASKPPEKGWSEASYILEAVWNPTGPACTWVVATEVTKPYEFIEFEATEGTKPYEFIEFGAMEVTKPYEFIIHGSWAAGKS